MNVLVRVIPGNKEPRAPMVDLRRVTKSIKSRLELQMMMVGILA